MICMSGWCRLKTISATVQVHKDGRSAIHHAAIYGVVDTVERLLGRGVDADWPTADGKTPVLLAAVEGHADIVRLLIQFGCDVNRVYEDAMTPLSAAASGQHLAAMNGSCSPCYVTMDERNLKAF